jgi:hypothetical protein
VITIFQCSNTVCAKKHIADSTVQDVLDILIFSQLLKRIVAFLSSFSTSFEDVKLSSGS